MHKPLTILLLLLSLSSCYRSVAEHVRFNVAIPEKNARAEIVRIGTRLAGFGPLMMYDRKRSILNVALMKPTSFAIARQTVHAIGFALKPGLLDPSNAFVKQTQCYLDHPCNTEDYEQCSFEAKIPFDQYRSTFDTFSKNVLYGGYPVLGVFFRQGDNHSVTVNVPMYDDCDTGGNDLNDEWSHVSPLYEVKFHIQ